MVVRNETGATLPASYVFITLSRGHAHKTYALRRGVLIAAAMTGAVAAVWLAGCTLYVAFHDQMVNALMVRQRDMQYDYEDRIAVLRTQIDRSTSRQLLNQRSVEAKLDELTLREAELQTRSDSLVRMADQVSRLTGHQTALTVPPDGGAQSMPHARPLVVPKAGEAAALLSSHKPRPEEAEPELDTPPHDRTSERDTLILDRVAMLSAGLNSLATVQDRQLAALESQAQDRLARVREALNETGLNLDRFGAQMTIPAGGPFVPLSPAQEATPFGRATVGLQIAIGDMQRLTAAVAHIPLAKPLSGTPEITSPFGVRVDPFLGRPGMHTGLDLRDDTGTDVLATAPGHVTVAGPSSGYGTMVEIDHGAGLVTRYAHLSATAVGVGESVRTGEIIGQVGATGRATGPHLHYETRIDGEPVDPMRFLQAGRRLLADRGSL